MKRLFVLSVLMFISLCGVTFSMESSDQTSAQSLSEISKAGMRFIKAGPFRMGANKGVGMGECEKYRDDCKEEWFYGEFPSRIVFVKGFYIDIYEVTQAEYMKVMGNNPSRGKKGGNLPVDVTWEEAKTFCEKVGKRLPTEIEWEKAAHGGTSTIYYWGDELGPYANFSDVRSPVENRNEKFDDGFSYTAPVGSFPPNNYGLYDMAGNVWEWIADDYTDQYQDINPLGPNKDRGKGLRGGGWTNTMLGLRPSFRDWTAPNARHGIRCALDGP